MVKRSQLLGPKGIKHKKRHIETCYYSNYFSYFWKLRALFVLVSMSFHCFASDSKPFALKWWTSFAPLSKQARQTMAVNHVYKNKGLYLMARIWIAFKFLKKTEKYGWFHEKNWNENHKKELNKCASGICNEVESCLHCWRVCTRWAPSGLFIYIKKDSNIIIHLVI